MKFILGKKINMTEVFSEDGKVHPATVIDAGPITVTALRSPEKDGYRAIQVGFGVAKERRLSKAVKGSTKALGMFRVLKEFRVADAAEYKVGDTITVSVFKAGDAVSVSGTSKGKGFQGVVKRHRFAGGSRTHGQKHSEREPGAIGGGARAGGRVAKGMRMAGRMGGTRVTVKNLSVIEANPETNTLLVRGAVPGIRGALLEIKSS